MLQKFISATLQAPCQRQASSRESTTVVFIKKGCEKRRTLAVQRAQVLQRELGVIPKLRAVAP